jgi:hypothetical protein
LDLIKDSDDWRKRKWLGTITDNIDYRKHYAYDEEMDGLSMETRIATLEQAVYELKQEKKIRELEDKINALEIRLEKLETDNAVKVS